MNGVSPLASCVASSQLVGSSHESSKSRTSKLLYVATNVSKICRYQRSCKYVWCFCLFVSFGRVEVTKVVGGFFLQHFFENGMTA
jgi:hypothetical protein